jgi:hypothetical protein
MRRVGDTLPPNKDALRDTLRRTDTDAHFGTLRKRLFLLGIELADALFEARETFEGGDLFVSVHGAHGRGETSRPEG